MGAIVLGGLSELVYTDRTTGRLLSRKPLRKLLAWDPADKRLHCVESCGIAAPSGEDAEELERFWRDFHWEDESQSVQWVCLTVPSGTPTRNLGRLEAITYETAKGGKNALWEHWFDRHPQLWEDAARRLYLLGEVVVTSRGIVS